MDMRQVVSLLLVGQMLGAPLAQAALSPIQLGSRGDTETALQVRQTEAGAAGEREDAATASPLVTEVVRPEESPDVTATPVPAPEATQAPPMETAAPTPTPEATADVVATSAPAQSSAPDATAVPTPETTTPAPSPEATMPVTTPAPEATPVPSAVPSPSPAAEAEKKAPRRASTRDWQSDALLTKNWPFNRAYIGFGYDVYRADQPAADHGVKTAGQYSEMGNDLQDIHYADFAVEKPLDASDDIRKAASIVGDVYKDENAPVRGWNPREDGKYYAEDICIEYNEDPTSWFPELKYLSLADIANNWLGRLPDYQFEGWYVSGLKPSKFGFTKAQLPPLTLWMEDYIEQEFENQTAPGVVDRVTKIPIAYCDTEKIPAAGFGPDYPLTDGPLDYEQIRDRTVALYENVGTPDPLYPGTKKTDENSSEWNNEFMEVELPIIAHWKLSEDATLVDSVLLNNEDPGKRETVKTAVYSVRNGKMTTENVLEDLYDKPFSDPNTKKATFDGKKGQTYYLCVNADIDAIAPRILAAEPFRTDEAGTGAGVAIRFRAAGETTYVDYAKAGPEDEEETADYELSHKLLNGSVEDGGVVKLYNNAMYPLRSQWTVASEKGDGVLGVIPLTRATGGDADTDRYNEVEITVTAPDGKTTNVYTIFIERLNDPYVVQNSGNTPYGMIARESDESWAVLAGQTGKTVDEVRETAYDRFLNGYLSSDASANGRPYSFNRYNYTAGSPNNVYYPNDRVENNGGNYELNAVYDPRAWGSGDNVDLDATALVVYQDSSFVDPGITVYDSEGRKIDLSKGTVKRNLTLRTAASGLRMSELSDDYGQEGYYAGKSYGESGRMQTAADLWEEAFQAVKDPDGKDRIDLRGLNVVPGVYTMEYRFTDAQRKFTDADAAQNFDSKATSLFVDKENPGRAATFTRTLVVLPLPGDVDMDGLVTTADAEALQRELDGGSSFINSGSKVSMLYNYRVCDVNYDGIVDGRDVSELAKGYVPKFKRNSDCEKYFYIPLQTGMTAEEEAAWHAGKLWDGSTAVEAGKGSLSLEYLGRHDETVTDAAALAGISSKDKESGETVKLSKDDIFWVGVKADLSTLAAVDAALKNGVAALKLSVVYDSTYLEPAVLATVGDDTNSRWRNTLAAYNISGTAADDVSLWPSTYQLVESGCQMDTAYVLHYSRTTPATQTAADVKQKMLTVTLRDTAGAAGHRKLAGAAGDGTTGRYLFRIPFKLKYADPNDKYLEALELSLSAQDMGALTEAAEVRPAVWTSQSEPVFGGVSANLADELSYVGGSARRIPLADQDLADAVELVNQWNGGKTVYGEAFRFADSSAMAYQDPEKIRLPKGLTYNRTLGSIEGTIEETGTFTFAVTHNDESTTYYIEVKKAPLTLYAVPQERYYGEPNGSLEFRYDPADIRPVDLPGGANYVATFQNDGSAEELSKLGGYKPPRMTTAVTQDTDVGSYYINISSADSGSELSSYHFVYAGVTLDEAGQAVVSEATGDAAKSPLTIRPRPLVVGRMTDAAASDLQVNVDTAMTVFRNRTTSYQKDKAAEEQGFEPVALGGNASYPDYKDSLTGDAVYGKDEVTVTFTIRLTRENTAPPYYDLNGAPSKKVEAAVEDLKLAETADNANYKLVKLVDSKTHATVTGNPIVSVSMEGWSSYSGYSSGDILSFNFMRVIVSYEKDDKTDSTIYLGDDAALDPQFGHIYLTWVSAEDKAKGESHYDDASHLLKNGQEMLTGVHNGKYLCVTVLQSGKPISWFSETPFEVLKRKLTLTAKPLTVYYGEYKADMLDFTYDPRDLTPTDRQALTDKLGHAPTGSSAELAVPGVVGLANLTLPVLSAWSGAQGTSEEVSADTSVQWDGASVKPSKIYIENAVNGETILSGADEYRFVFTGAPAGQERKYGVSDLNILPRPIMVDTVTMGEASKVFLYDDTTDWILQRMYYTENGVPVARQVTLAGRNTAAATAQEGADTFVAGAYNFRQEQGKDCYYVAGSLQPVPLEAPNPTGSPIHVNKDGKMDEVVVTYVATYQRDMTSAVPPETSFFTMDGKAKKTVPVTVNGLALPKDVGANNNYKLVYRLLRLANSTSPEDGQTTGVVKLRAIKKLEVSADAKKRVYTYGELMELGGMTLHMTYESEGDNALNQNMARNVIERTVYYSDTGDGSDSFANQGLQVYWKMDPDLTVSSGVIEDSVLSGYLAQGKIVPTDVDGLGRYPDAAKTGKSLIVCGRRFDGDGGNAAHELVWGEGTAAFTIEKKTLPLTLEAQDRYYGEYIQNYRAYYAFSDLSLPDQKALSAAGYTPELTINGKGYFYISAARDAGAGGREVSENVVCDLDFTDGVNDALGWLNKDYLDPGTQTSLGVRFTSTAVQASEVGTYSVSMEPVSVGNMANYVFDGYTPERLRIFRRPIVIEKILETLPTIYYNTPETEFPTMVAQTGSATAGAVGFQAGLPALTNGSYDNSAKDQEIQAAVNAGMSAAMPLSGNAIYGNDELALYMTVVYPAYDNRVGFPAGQYQVDQPVAVKDMRLVDEYAKNYFLVYRAPNDEFYRQPADPTAMGQLDKRPITAIDVLELPRMDYTYGQTLNLTRLKLQVTYGVIAGESYPERDDLFYSQLTGRLSVNYWENERQEDGTFGPKPLPVVQADYGVGIRNRQAKMGDHLTIAPAHDAGTVAGESADFAHNGKYLILTARADADMNYDARPVLVNDGGTPVPLTVRPLDLTYTLTAGDRTYNDKAYATRTATSGTIALSNVYGSAEQGLDQNGAVITIMDRDLVYVAADKTFDRAELAQMVNDAYKTSADVYVFSVDGSDQTGRMAFDFYDENVMYYEGEYTAEDPVTPENWVEYWNSGLRQRVAKQPTDADWNSYGEVAPMPVLVSGLKLMGPDAANYTLDEWVGRRDDVAAIYDDATANAAKAQAPYAVMHKASQSVSAAERPLLSVDDRSNTVRLTYETSLETVRPDLADASPDAFQDEYHYQYGLEYQDPVGEDPTALRQWREWSDHAYFGGEKLEVRDHAAEEALELSRAAEKDEVVKGQCYPWMAEDVDPVTGASLFGTREPLARDTVYWGMVRLAETHNYLPSVPVRAYQEDSEDPAVAEAAAAEQRAAALKNSEEISQAVLAWVQNKPKDEHPELPLGPAPAVKTYTQSFELISTEEKLGAAGTRYSINTLEAVWFTDIQKYGRKEELSAVLRNIAKTRYYSFYWDEGKSAQVEFGREGLDLSQEEFLVEVTERQPDGSNLRVMKQVNIGDDPSAPRPYSAVVYVSTKNNGGSITIPDISIGGGGGGGGAGSPGASSGELRYELESPPQFLEVTFRPASAIAEGIAWTSSDPKVVRVDKDGRMIFVGVGTAEITATTLVTRRTAKATVTVTAPEGRDVGVAWSTALELAGRTENRFDFYQMGAFMRVDEDYLFHPEWALTRSELVLVLERFYQAGKDWQWDGKPTFTDVSGREAYAAAAELFRDSGILKGLPNGAFGGGKTATRAEVATILCRMMGLTPEQGGGASKFFEDCGANYAWANGCIDALTEAGVIKGTDETHFTPEREINRAELAAMLGRILLTGVNYSDAPLTPRDMTPDHWAYELVLRAVNQVVPREK